MGSPVTSPHGRARPVAQTHGRAAGSGLEGTPTAHDHRARHTRPGKHVVHVAGLPKHDVSQRSKVGRHRTDVRFRNGEVRRS